MATPLATIGKNIRPDGKITSCGDLDRTPTGTPFGHPSATATGTGKQGVDINISISTPSDRVGAFTIRTT